MVRVFVGIENNIVMATPLMRLVVVKIRGALGVPFEWLWPVNTMRIRLAKTYAVFQRLAKVQDALRKAIGSRLGLF
jgi:hypothetical protein